MKEEYQEYKQVKAKLRLLEVLLSKQEVTKTMWQENASTQKLFGPLWEIWTNHWLSALDLYNNLKNFIWVLAYLLENVKLSS